MNETESSSPVATESQATPATSSPEPSTTTTESSAEQSQWDVPDQVFDDLEPEGLLVSDRAASPPEEQQAATPKLEPQRSEPVNSTQPAPVQAPPPPAAPPQQVQPQQVGGQQQQTGQVSGPQAQAQPQSWGQLMDQGRQTMIAEMARSHFGLTKEEAAAAEIGDMSWVPNYGSRVAFESIRSSVEMIERAMPQMIVRILELQNAQRSAEDELFKDFEDLRPMKEKVYALGHTIRQLNPTMSRADFIRLLGMQARHLFGTQVPAPAAPRVPQQPPSQQPAMRGAGQNGFKPIVSAVPTGVRATPVNPNDWAVALDEMDRL